MRWRFSFGCDDDDDDDDDGADDDDDDDDDDSTNWWVSVNKWVRELGKEWL